MIINGLSLLDAAPIKDMLDHKVSAHGVSHGLGEAGYDIRIKQTVTFQKEPWKQRMFVSVAEPDQPLHAVHSAISRFTLASAMDEFQMPPWLVGVVHDKSTWARRGLSVFNTVIEPGWNGFLTLELVYHGDDKLVIPAGAGIAQVLFTSIVHSSHYDGKYQNQEDRPVAAKSSVASDVPVGTLELTGGHGEPCPNCGQPLSRCPSGLVCPNGHGF